MVSSPSRSFVTIKIFARTELYGVKCGIPFGFVTIKIFARTERIELDVGFTSGFVTIRIFIERF